MTAADHLIIALDYPSAGDALDLVSRLDGTCRWFKVGLQLYLATGPSFVATLRERGFNIFLDLKLHDIPNTVAGAVRSVSSTGASLLTVHAAGGSAMLAAAAHAARLPGAPKLLAITVLTSMDVVQLQATGVPGEPITQVLRLAHLAREAGIGGMVCSPQEVRSLRDAFGPTTTLAVPGIRPSGTEAGDQKRIATAATAMHAGASYLVVGRPITRAVNPAEAASEILNEIGLALRTKESPEGLSGLLLA